MGRRCILRDTVGSTRTSSGLFITCRLKSFTNLRKSPLVSGIGIKMFLFYGPKTFPGGYRIPNFFLLQL